MKKFLIGCAVVLSVAVVGGYLFRDTLMAAATDRITADMFVASDTDAYDPGVAVGQPLPAIRALYHGQEITSVDAMMGPRGMILIANRSVDW